MDGDTWEGSAGAPDVGGVGAVAVEEEAADGRAPVWHWMTGGCWP